MLSVTEGLLLQKYVYVDITRYRYYADYPQVSKFCALPAEHLASWRGKYMVDLDAICSERAILPSGFRYLDQIELLYRIQQVRWEQRTLLALGWFVRYPMCCCYHLRETACDRLLVRIPLNFVRLEVCHGFRFEQKSIFYYK